MTDSDSSLETTSGLLQGGGEHADLPGQLALLRRFDRDLYILSARKMVNYLCWVGVDGAQDLLLETYGEHPTPDTPIDDVNVPGPATNLNKAVLLSGKPFDLASSVLGADKVQELIQGWVVEERTSFLPKILNNPRSTLDEVAESLRRFHHLVADGAELSPATHHGIRVSLIRRFLTEELGLITIAKDYFDTGGILELLDRVIVASDGHGRLGGKTTELFLARQILAHASSDDRPVGEIKVPRSWFISSEEITVFLEYNHLEEVLQQKYRGR